MNSMLADVLSGVDPVDVADESMKRGHAGTSGLQAHSVGETFPYMVVALGVSNKKWAVKAPDGKTVKTFTGSNASAAAHQHAAALANKMKGSRRGRLQAWLKAFKEKRIRVRTVGDGMVTWDWVGKKQDFSSVKKVRAMMKDKKAVFEL